MKNRSNKAGTSSPAPSSNASSSSNANASGSASSSSKSSSSSSSAAASLMNSFPSGSGYMDLLNLLPREYPKAQEDREVLDNQDYLTFVPILRGAILGLICLMSILIRLFAVVRFESVIHEFDPHFNYRVTKFLTSEGFYDFLNWMDDRAWYPLGRIVGGTVYPGLMVTSGFLHNLLHMMNIPINVRNMCVFLAPLFAALTAIATYLFTTEVTRRPSTGLLAAAFVGIVPSYISRSVGGSYDNEGVAIFALIFTFYLWVKSVNTGSLMWSALCALSYFYMVAAWGGFVFIINIIPIYCLVMLLAGRYSPRLYVAYSTFYVLGSLLAMQVPFVGFNVVMSAETAGAHGTFVVMQVYPFIVWLRSHVSAKVLQRLFILVAGGVVGTVAVGLVALQLMGKIQWTGRSLSLLDPTYAKKYIPIIASVSEHQPTTWVSFFFDLHIMVPFAPVGIYFLFQNITDGKIFLILYGSISWYFAGVMVRLMLTLAPVACILGAIAISEVLHRFTFNLTVVEKPTRSTSATDQSSSSEEKKENETTPSLVATANSPWPLSLLVVGLMSSLLLFYTVHSTFVSSEAYSSPSVVLASRRYDGSRVIYDDFREAYYWLRQNTPENAKILSWWDYGYQMSSMANRTVIVDNNTWNNTHIATVGRSLASPEHRSYPIMRSLDVDYVLVLFGGMMGYQSDDINKFLWMVRIANGVYPDEIQEQNYFANGQYRMDKGGAPAMLESVMYKLSYYGFGEIQSEYNKPTGWDRVRSTEVGRKNIVLENMDEAFTSEHWIVRIYKVRKQANRPGGRLELRKERNKKANKPQVSLKDEASANEASSKAEDPQTKVDRIISRSVYVGCTVDENVFSKDKVYGGGAAGAQFKAAAQDAITKGKKYFAIARVGSDGHSFSFDSLPSADWKGDIEGAGCSRSCIDDDKRMCGCADGGCTSVGDNTPLGQDHNRRWTVYKVSA